MSINGVVYGKVLKSFPQFGFARIEGTNLEVLVHMSQRCKVVRNGPEEFDLGFTSESFILRPPRVGEELVLTVRQTPKGGAATAWALKREWNGARPARPAPRQDVIPASLPAPFVVLPVQKIEKTDLPLTLDEMLETLDTNFHHAVLDAIKKEGLSSLLVRDFVRHPPKIKHHETMWDEYHKRKALSRKGKEYGIAAFIKDVLEEAGFIAAD